MPNYTWNSIEARPEVIKSLLNKKGEFNFNTFVRMPKELVNTTAGGRVSEIVALYLLDTYKKADAIAKIHEYGAPVINYKGTVKAMKEELLKITCGKTVDEEYEWIRSEDGVGCKPGKLLWTKTGEEYWNIFKKYGYRNWYDWCNAKWGTKWNAFDVNITDNCISYTTAWCMPRGVINAICKKFPNESIKFSAEYEDPYREDGHNEGGKYVVDNTYSEEYDEDTEEYYWVNDNTGERVDN